MLNFDIQKGTIKMNNYNNGGEMWRDNATSYGIDEAISFSRSYLDLNLKREHSDEESQFTLEMFSAMYYATKDRIVPIKLVYPYDFETASKREESSYYYLNRLHNSKCAQDIDNLIADYCYKTNFYNLKTAAMMAIMDYGFPRVCMILAFHYQQNDVDGRLSSTNKKWIKNFTGHYGAFKNARLQSHATVIDGFCNHIRELYQTLSAEKTALLGNEVHDEFDGDTEIKREITVSDNGHGYSYGYAIGHNPITDEWVCWRFTVHNNEKYFNWGVFSENEQMAIDSCNARMFVAFN